MTPWTVARQAPLSKEFSRQGYWSGLPSPSPVDLPDPGIEPASLVSPVLTGGFFTSCTIWRVVNINACHMVDIVDINHVTEFCHRIQTI